MNIDQIFTVAPFSWSELGAAILCGLIVGLERQLRGNLWGSEPQP